MTLLQSVDTFVSHMARDEPDRAKRAKLDALQLFKDEWDRVKLFLDLLVVRKICHREVCILTHSYSMLSRHNKPSPQMKGHPFTRPGLYEPRRLNIFIFGMH